MTLLDECKALADSWELADVVATDGYTEGRNDQRQIDAKALRAIIARHASLPLEGIVRYLRFGDIPSKSHDYHSGRDEVGVSVYEAVERDGRIGVILPTLNECACVSLSGVVRRPAYWVTGTVIGHGSDGEPLLADCRIVESLGVIVEAVPASRKPAVEGLVERVAK